MTHHELHPLCTLFPRLAGVGIDSTRYSGMRADSLAVAEFDPSQDHPGFWDGSVSDITTGTQVTTCRPISMEGAALLLDEYGGRNSWNLSALPLRPVAEVSAGFIYFIQATSGGPVKIGWTRGPIGARLDQLQCGNPETLRVIGSVENASLRDERDLHARFSAIRLRGEWFRASPELLAYAAEASA
jgi:hypothetical protein